MEPSDIFNAIDFLFPDRFAKPDGKALDFQAAPFRRQEMPQLVNRNEQVEEQHHFQRDENISQNRHYFLTFLSGCVEYTSDFAGRNHGTQATSRY